MTPLEYKNYPPLPQWLEDHLYGILKKQSSNPITYDDNFKEKVEMFFRTALANYRIQKTGRFEQNP